METSLIRGAWAIEVADEFPTARVIGMDLSPIQPHHIPRNCEFRVGDLTQDLADFNSGSVDLVHSRCVNFNDGTTGFNNCRFVHAGIKTHEWPKYMNDIFRILKPGQGWAQCTETIGCVFEDDNVPPDCVLPKVHTHSFYWINIWC